MDNKDRRVPVMMNREDKDTLKEAAKKARISLGAFMLRAALDAVRKEQDG